VLRDDLFGAGRLKVCDLGFGFCQLLLRALDAPSFTLSLKGLFDSPCRYVPVAAITLLSTT
jgi:hypothetical protein